MKYGLILDVPSEEDYVFGGFTKLPKEVLQPDGQWDDWLVETEIQRKKIETQNCVAFGSTTILEILLKRKDKLENFSDRQLGIVSNTDPHSGNTTKRVAQAIRDFGLIPEEMLPFEEFNSPSDYYEPKPLPKKLLEKGQEFLEEYEVLYENVPTDIETIKINLTFAPCW